MFLDSVACISQFLSHRVQKQDILLGFTVGNDVPFSAATGGRVIILSSSIRVIRVYLIRI